MTEVPYADPDLDEIPAFLRPAEPAPAPEAPVTLPPSGSGERARRRRQRRRLTWRRHSLLLAIGVIVVVATLAAVRPWHGGSTRSASRPQAATPAHVGPLTSSAVLVQQDAQGAAASITVLVASP